MYKEKRGNEMKKRKILLATVALTCAFATIMMKNQMEVDAQDFSGNEDYWTDVCSKYTTDQSTINACNEYRNYLNQKQNEKQAETQDAQTKIDEMQGDLTKLGNLAYDYEQQLLDVEAQITTIRNSITEAENSIAAVQVLIEEQQAKVNERKSEIKERMVDIQASMNANEYINFIMAAESLVDFIQRSESIGTITDYDNQKLEQLSAEIKKLDNDKKEKVRLQEALKAQQANLDSKKQELETKKAESDQVLAALVQRQSQLASQRDAASAEAENLASLMPSVPVPPSPEPGEGGGGSGSGSLNWNRDFYSGFYTSPYNKISNANLTGQCTWYCFGRASEVNGSYLRESLPTGNANQWYWIAASRGFAVGSTPRANAIIVWGNGQYGHVAFVEAYSGDSITISEGNVNAPGGGLDYGTSLETAIQYTNVAATSYSALVAQRGQPIGFIYL